MRRLRDCQGTQPAPQYKQTCLNETGGDMHANSAIAALLAACSLLIGEARADPVTYTITNVYKVGASSIGAAGLNNAGVAVGSEEAAPPVGGYATVFDRNGWAGA